MWCLEFAQEKTLSRGFSDEYSFKQLRRRDLWSMAEMLWRNIHEYLLTPIIGQLLTRVCLGTTSALLVNEQSITKLIVGGGL